MRRRRYAFPFATTIALLVLAALPRVAAAQDLSGTYHVTQDQTTVQIPEWGTDCGPRPTSRNGVSGREATITSDGAQLAVQDGRHRTRTDGCWSDNPRVRRISASHTGTRWTVICQTADDDYQHEQGTYTIQVDGSHITMRESSEYSWQLRESRCRASASRTLAFERAPDANPVPVDAGHAVAVTPPPPTNRCATPGAAARLQVSPGRRPLAPGGRGCFRARFLDANSCEVTTGLPAVGWSMARSGGAPGASDALMENGCVRAPAGSGVGEYTVTATAGTLTATAIASVVSAEELQSLVAAQFEDEDAGVPALAPTAAASGTSVGAVVVQTPPPPADASRGGSFLWILIGLGAVLAVAGVFLLTGQKKKPARTSLNPDRPSDPSAGTGRVRRHSEPIPIKELRAPPKPLAPAAPPSAAAIAPPAPRPLVKRCPQCDARFTAEIAFCPEHGQALVAAETPAAPGNATVIAGSGGGPRTSSAICPRCSQPVEPGAQFCPRDGTPILGPSPALPLLCPRCRRRFPDATAFCGDDGSALVRE